MINPIEPPIPTVPKMLRSFLVVSSHSCMLFLCTRQFFSIREMRGRRRREREDRRGREDKKG